MMTVRFERRELSKLFFYVDILVAGVFALALVLLVRDTYAAGWYDARSDPYHQGVNSWYMMRDAVLAAASLAWLLYRYFTGQVQRLVNPWA